VREGGEGARGAGQESGGDIGGEGVLRGGRVEGAGLGEDEGDESELLLVLGGTGVALCCFPLPRRLLANSQVLAAGQQRLEVDAARDGIRVFFQQALVQHAEVRVAGDKGNGYNGVDGVRACLLGHGEEDGRDVAVVPAGTGLLGVASRLPATGEVSEHCEAAALRR